MCNFRELISKNSTITTLRKREEEYLSLISTLKLNLEKTKDNAKSNISSVKEFDTLKEKLFEQRKASIFNFKFAFYIIL